MQQQAARQAFAVLHAAASDSLCDLSMCRGNLWSTSCFFDLSGLGKANFSDLHEIHTQTLWILIISSEVPRSAAERSGGDIASYWMYKQFVCCLPVVARGRLLCLM